MRRRKYKRRGILAFLLGFLLALIAGHVRADVWQTIGEDTYIGNFYDVQGRPFTCIMVKAEGGRMVPEVKTLACPGVIYVTIPKEALHEIEAHRLFMPESRKLPVLPGRPNAQAPQAQGVSE